MSSIVNAIKRTHKWADDNNQPIIYWAIDLHGTVLKPTYERGTGFDFYPYAEECLRYLAKDDNNVLIMFSSSWPNSLHEYMDAFRSIEIHFKYVNVNPDVQTNLKGHGYYFDKFYFNVMLEDKAGFEPETDWKDILDYMKGRK